MSTGEEGVCIIVAVFRSRDTIARAVHTALAQPEACEVVVVDDASGDGTADAARGADDGSGRLRVIELARNAGPARARNRALEESRSAYFCVLDADDYLLPGRIARLLAAGPRDWDLLADDIVIVPQPREDVDLACAKIGPNALPVRLDLVTFLKGNISHPQRPREELGFLKPIIRRDFLLRHGLRYDETLRLGEDYALYAKALAHGARFYVVSACGYIAVERHDSLSERHSTQDLKQLVMFDDRCSAELANLSTAECAAFAAHRTSALRRYQYRVILDRKREGGMLRAVGALARMPDAIPYIASQTVRARLARLGWGTDGGSARTGPRLLIGEPMRPPRSPSSP